MEENKKNQEENSSYEELEEIGAEENNGTIEEFEQTFGDYAEAVKKPTTYLYNHGIEENLLDINSTDLSQITNGYYVRSCIHNPIQFGTKIVEKCKENVEYIGYISAIKAREYTTTDSRFLNVRVVCTLLIGDEFANFYYDVPSYISEKSELASLLVKLKFPAFNIGESIELDSLLNKPITASLKKSTKNGDYYYVGDIKAR